MSAIPQGLFRTGEWNLHHKGVLVDAAMQQRDKILSMLIDTISILSLLLYSSKHTHSTG